MIGQIGLEYGCWTVFGAAAGAAIGLATATLIAPFFRIPDGAGVPLPPLIPLIAREETLWLALFFAGCMVLVESAILLRALNVRLFDALRMGHHG